MPSQEVVWYGKFISRVTTAQVQLFTIQLPYIVVKTNDLVVILELAVSLKLVR